jgi:predicted  nucleic acid-binding Zn-ribbon protein
MLSGAKDQGDAMLKAAREEAVQHIAAARASAVKIRRESERELQAAVARRDAINAQLANVRQMLATLDNTSSSLSGKLHHGEEEQIVSAEETEFAHDVAEAGSKEAVGGEKAKAEGEPVEGALDELTEVLTTEDLASVREAENEGMVAKGRR